MLELLKEALELNKQLKTLLPEFNLFNENNWESIDFEIKMLEDAIKCFSEHHFFNEKGFKIELYELEDEGMDSSSAVSCMDFIIDSDMEYIKNLRDEIKIRKTVEV